MLVEISRLAALPDGELVAQWSARSLEAASARHPGHAAAANRAPSRSAYAATRRAPRKPEDRIVQLLLMQASWWDRLTAEDHELLHSLASPHGELVGWLESDLNEHGPRPWAALRAALGADASLQTTAANWGDEVDDGEADFSDLRRLIDGRLLEALEAQQRLLADSVATNAAAREAYQRLFVRMRQLKKRIDPGAESLR